MFVGLAIVSAGGGNSNAVTDDQIAVGTGQDIEGDANLTWDGLTLTIGGEHALTVTGLVTASDALTVAAGVVTIPAGAVGAPSLTFASDANTGVYRAAADQVALAAGGAQVLRAQNDDVGGFPRGIVVTGTATVSGLVTASAALTVSTGVITTPAGTVGAPSSTFAGDTNTGPYSPGADQWAVAAGGSQVLRVVNTSGVLTAVLTGALTVNGAAGAALITLTDGANIATDASLGNGFKVTLGGNRTLDNPTNLVAGFTYVWIVIQDGTGSRTLAYGNAFLWPNDAAPVLSTAAAAIDVISAVCLSTTQLLCTYRFNFS